MNFDAKPVPVPLQRSHKKRLSEEVKKMEVGQSFVCDIPTAHSFRMTAKYWGWDSCQQKIDDLNIRCWRTK